MHKNIVDVKIMLVKTLIFLHYIELDEEVTVFDYERSPLAKSNDDLLGHIDRLGISIKNNRVSLSQKFN